MEEFLHVFVAFLAAAKVIPPEVTSEDTEREKTYLQSLPDDPDNVYCFRIYDGALPTLTDKQAGVYRIQATVRNHSQTQALANVSTLWRFLIARPEFIEDIGNGYWVIIDAQSVPIPVGRDEKGNYLYTLNFPVKTKMY